MRTYKSPCSRVPFEAFYAPDGRLVLDYGHRHDPPSRSDCFRTYALDSNGEWDTLHTRDLTTPYFGTHLPWDACWNVDPHRTIGMTLVFQEKPPPMPLPTISATGGGGRFVPAHITKKAKFRYTTDYAEHQRQAIKNLNFKGVHYGYYTQRAYQTGLWFDFLGNTVGGAQPRLVAKVRLKDGWWRDPWHPPGSHPGFQAEWTEYPLASAGRAGHIYSNAIFCPDMGRHYRVNTRRLWHASGCEYLCPAGCHIAHAVVRGDLLAVSLARSNMVVAQHLKTLPRVQDAHTTVPAATVVFLDPDTLEVKKEMSFCDPKWTPIRPGTKQRQYDPNKFTLMAISPTCDKLAMAGRLLIREIDID